ncbi:MAG: hypothetical protein V4568_17755 [Pseudomonadota bacterium]
MIFKYSHALALLLIAFIESGASAAEGGISGSTSEPLWVIDPNVVGDNLPPTGRSLFDFLVTQRKGNGYIYDVPFPFDALRKRIQASPQQNGAAASSVKQVLIPLGRSLQRTAAAPEFFKYPRAVLAVDGEPSLQGEYNVRPTMLLKDRLYIGYQEKTNLLEVISYNEAAARFEFQIVKDYRPGGSPKVFYANRAVCMSCHQNGAPIFSRQVWDETNANPKVAALLRSFRREMFGIPVDRGIDVPYAIDNATDRANLLAVYQLVWREGCGGNDADAIRCRAGLFTGLLQYKLSGNQQFDRNASQYREQTVARISATAQKRWPGGLAIGNPDIPNRDPLPGETGLGLPNDLLMAATGKGNDANARKMLANLSNVSAAFEPLNPRPPLEVWPISQPEQTARVVAGLSTFVADADIARLNAYLIDRSSREKTSYRTYQARCKINRKTISSGRQRTDFVCSAAQVVAMTGYLELERGRIVNGVLDSLQLNNQEALRDITLPAATIKTHGGKSKVGLRLHRNNAPVRSVDGNLIERIELTWPNGSSLEEGAVTVAVREDFKAVERVIAKMVEDGFDGFSAKPFRRVGLMAGLFARLGMRSMAFCCADDTGMPPPIVESHQRPVVPVNRNASDPKVIALQSFYRNCATCHQTTERFPPNFLAGTSARVSENITQCAERLFVRLSMWQFAADARQKSPMPPVNAVHGAGYSSESWRDGEELAILKRYVESTLKNQTGNVPRLEEMMRGGYENLRACLPGADGYTVR